MGKFIKSCQVCGGPISGGRCRYCGMPYRNDEERYHLNEDRREHYRHASAATRRKMENEEKALPDQKRPQRTAVRQQQTSVRPQAQKTYSPQRPTAQQISKGENMPQKPALAKNQSYAKKGGAATSLYAIIAMVIVLLLLNLQSCNF